jgi:hypothetical protein
MNEKMGPVGDTCFPVETKTKFNTFAAVLKALSSL